MFREDLFDKRLKDNPYIYLLGGITFAGLALYCGYQIIRGMMTGTILEIDCRNFRCLHFAPMKGQYDRFSDAPLGYLFYLGGWLLADVLDPPQEYPYVAGYYAVFFADPDGIKLEYVHVPARESEQGKRIKEIAG